MASTAEMYCLIVLIEVMAGLVSETLREFLFYASPLSSGAFWQFLVFLGL